MSYDLSAMSYLASFQITGLRKLQRVMERRSKRLRQRRTVNARAIAITDRWIQKNFREEGKLAGDGTPWAPLKAATLGRRRKGLKQSSDKILQDTGTLRKRWKSLWTAVSAKIQSGVNYGWFHQHGTRKMPQRKILPTQKQLGPLLKKIYGKFVKTAIK